MQHLFGLGKQPKATLFLIGVQNILIAADARRHTQIFSAADLAAEKLSALWA